MDKINPKTLDILRKRYPVNARVVLLQMDDSQAPPVGTHGTVKYIDDTGTIHVHWDNGSTLGVLYGEDRCDRIKGET